MQDIGEGTQVLTSRNGRMFSDEALQVRNDVTGAQEPAEPLALIPANAKFLKATDPWLTDRDVVCYGLAF